MGYRTDPPTLGRALPTVQGLVERILAADLDPVQSASMEMHLSHLIRLGGEWASLKALAPRGFAVGPGSSATRGASEL